MKNLSFKKSFKTFIQYLQKRKVDKITQRKLKQLFRYHFEGINDYDIEYGYSGKKLMEPVVDIPVFKFGVTAINIFKLKKDVVMEIHLERPGLLIGKHGKTIDSLSKYLTDKSNLPLKILIKESKIWW